MESKLRKQRWGWEYVSKNGNTYSIGPVTAEFNVVVDDFEDVNELFDGEALIHSHLVDYVYGELTTDADSIKEWLDARIDRYEKHERTVKFYTNLLSRDDVDVLYECYIGTEMYQEVKTVNMSKQKLYKIASEVRGGK